MRRAVAILALGVLSGGCSDAPLGATNNTTTQPAAGVMQLTPVQTTLAGGQAEIIHFVPGSDSQLAYVNSNRAELGLVTADPTGFSIDEKIKIDIAAVNVGDSGITAIFPAPGGDYVLANKLDPNASTNGSVLLVDTVNNKGAILKELEVGVGPDSIWITSDGSYAVVANEAQDDAAIAGVISVIDLRGGSSAASVSESVLIKTADAQPESVAISPDDRIVAATVQEQSQIVLFELADPTGTLTTIQLPSLAKPDGIGFSPDGRLVVSANEQGDSFSVVEVSTQTALITYDIVPDIPAGLPRNKRNGVDPEGVVVLESGGINYALLALEDAGAIMYYSLESPAQPRYISWAPVGESREEARPEGIDANSATGLVFTANEGDGTITMLIATSVTNVSAPEIVTDPAAAPTSTVCERIHSDLSALFDTTETTIVINEFMASNDAAVSDPDDLGSDPFDDWLELYNTGATDVDISGWRMSDNRDDVSKYTFPAGTTLAAGEFLVLWADDETSDGPFHSRFKLSSDGEEILLFTSVPGQLADVVVFPAVVADISYGRTPDGGTEWREFDDVTPGTANDDAEPNTTCNK